MLQAFLISLMASYKKSSLCSGKQKSKYKDIEKPWQKFLPKINILTRWPYEPVKQVNWRKLFLKIEIFVNIVQVRLIKRDSLIKTAKAFLSFTANASTDPGMNPRINWNLQKISAHWFDLFLRFSEQTSNRKSDKRSNTFTVKIIYRSVHNITFLRILIKSLKHENNL